MVFTTLSKQQMFNTKKKKKQSTNQDQGQVELTTNYSNNDTIK